MNYGLRNTLILALTLILMTGGGWLFVNWMFSSTLEELKEDAEQKEQTLSELTMTADLYDETVMEHTRQVYIQENHPKELFLNPNAGRLYDYLITLNQGISFTELNYSVEDSIVHDHYGVVNVNVSGEGIYRNLYNFIYRMENSSPIIHIRSMQLQNINELEKLSRVNFQLSLALYYNRDDQFDRVTTLATVQGPGNIGHNPYYSLIHPVPPNEDEQVDVDNSRIIGMTSRYILVRDQNAALQRLTVGDRVYLGALQQIDTDDQVAVFHLNRGGLFDRVTLTLE